MLENRPPTVCPASPSRAHSVGLPPRQRSARTNNPFATIDKNTALGRRAADLVAAYMQALGNPADVERQAAIIAAAELQVLAEGARAVALKEPGTADLDRVVRMQGAADRAVKRLGLQFAPHKPAPGALLAQHLATLTPDEDDEGHAPSIADAPAEGGVTDLAPEAAERTGDDTARRDEASAEVINEDGA